ncbi:hypothetical protein [Paraglaciecola sp. MB-3u-78]|uniref:hypothetical protein n=1 Tax=Paraglaciecola sp. MB-3u-78 TaxID=2058332 RepID=UPI000C33C418|nr:hypothetical protein [Paraglaciecola sp. MB-3u-78]PKG98815.1 hypothetical protein CXF95_13260 [Paraglaciecola sp. MB-3u-78]
MLAFITSIRHPHNTNSYKKAVALYEIAARSICSQSNANFILVVVCNEKPVIEFHDERIHYHIVDFPVPPSLDEYLKTFSISDQDVSCHPKKYFPNRGDKGTKILSGLLYAKQFNPKYVYIVDADDWVNINIVQYLEEQADYPIWHVNEAYIVNFKQKTFMTRYGISRHCGSTFIYQTDFLLSLGNYNQAVDSSSSQQELMEATSVSYVHEICGNHTKQFALSIKKGTPAKPIPFPAICYVLETSENEVQHVDVNDGYPITRAVIDDFGLNESYLSMKKLSIKAYYKQGLAAYRSKMGWHLEKIKFHRKYNL